jgi:hypothetical protein
VRFQRGSLRLYMSTFLPYDDEAGNGENQESQLERFVATAH